MNKYFELAKKESDKSDHTKHKLGCVIVRKNKVLGKGHNLTKTHPKSHHQFKHIHAEFMAALRADFDLEGATVYVFRQNKMGHLSMSRPCMSCWQYLVDAGAKEVVYTIEGSFKKEDLKG